MPTLPRRAARQGTMCYVYIGALMPLFVVGMLVGYTRDGGQPAALAPAPVVGAAGLARSSGGVDTVRAVFSAAALHTESRQRAEALHAAPRSLQGRSKHGGPNKRQRNDVIASRARPLEDAEEAEATSEASCALAAQKRSTTKRLQQHYYTYYTAVRANSTAATLARYLMASGPVPVSRFVGEPPPCAPMILSECGVGTQYVRVPVPPGGLLHAGVRLFASGDTRVHVRPRRPQSRRRR